MATTTKGYEGTGRLFKIRVEKYLQRLGFCKLKLVEPIIYSKYDLLEEWLNEILLLNKNNVTVSKKSKVFRVVSNNTRLEKSGTTDGDKNSKNGTTTGIIIMNSHDTDVVEFTHLQG